MDIKIDNLANHTRFIPTLAHWFHEQWGHFQPQTTLEQRIARLQDRCTETGDIPITLIALKDHGVVGTASLVKHDMDVHLELTPWLSSVYVAHKHRHHGIGSRLVKRIVQEAQKMDSNMKKSIFKKSSSGAIAIGIFCLMLGCESTYYKTMETMGYHKRDIMVDRVQDARDAQEEAKDQFESALEQFSTVLNFQGGDLEEKYDKLKNEYEASEEKAQAVRLRIDEVEDVAEDLFVEWQEELDQYTSRSLRKSSARKLAETKRQYAQLIGAMKRAERKIDPVLNAFHDQVLYLKHNLNAQAIASLQSELVSIELDVTRLIKEMDASIKEANSFISSMQ